MADAQVQACGALLLIRNPDKGHGESVKLVYRLARITRAPGRLPACTKHFHIRGPQAAAAHALAQDGGNLRIIHAGREPPTLATARKALHMHVQAKERAVPHGDHIVGSIRMQKAQIGDRNTGLPNGHILSAHKSAAFGEI